MTPHSPSARPVVSSGRSPRASAGVNESRYWFSDREIGQRRRSPIAYSSQDFRIELERVERRLYRLTVISLVVAILAVVAIGGLFIQMLQ